MIKKLIILILLVPFSLSLTAKSVIDGATQIRECGYEDRDSKGQLSPFATRYSMSMNMECTDCEIVFTFDVPDKAGNPIVTGVKYSGMSSEDANKLQSIFETIIFPHCKCGVETHGFKNELRIYEN